MSTDIKNDVLFPCLHRFSNALNCIKRFSVENDLITNVSEIDNFFSAFRSTTFVLQHSVAHIDNYKEEYDRLSDKYLKQDSICKWMVETRNEIEKQGPISIIETLIITVYSHSNAAVIFSNSYTIGTDESIDSILEGIVGELDKYGEIETHFSIEFVFKKEGEDRLLYQDIRHAISQLQSLINEFAGFVGDVSKASSALLSEINEFNLDLIRSEAFFVMDYVYYNREKRFERGESLIPPDRDVRLGIDEMAKMYGGKYGISTPKEFMSVIASSHAFMLVKQKGELMPTLFITYYDNTCEIYPFDSTIRTTVYRKINSIAQMIAGARIKYVTLVHVVYGYNSFAHVNEEYYKRTQYADREMIAVDQIGNGFRPRTIHIDCRKANDITYVRDCIKDAIDLGNTIHLSYLYPLFKAFKETRKA